MEYRKVYNGPRNWLEVLAEGQFLVACGRYIERNPVSVGMALEAQEYSYSSARFYCAGKPDGITIVDSAFYEFGTDDILRQNFMLNS